MKKISIAVCMAAMFMLNNVSADPDYGGSSYNYNEPLYEGNPILPEGVSFGEKVASRQAFATDMDAVAICKSSRSYEPGQEIKCDYKFTPEQLAKISGALSSIEFAYFLGRSFTDGMQATEEPAYDPNTGFPEDKEIKRNRLTNLSGMSLTLHGLSKICDENPEIWSQAEILPKIYREISPVWDRSSLKIVETTDSEGKKHECIIEDAKRCYYDFSNNPELKDGLIDYLLEKMPESSYYFVREFNFQITGLTDNCINGLISLCQKMAEINNDDKNETVSYIMHLGGNKFTEEGKARLEKEVKNLKGIRISLLFNMYPVRHYY